MASVSRIKTRILIISDTHGRRPRLKLPDDPDTDEDIAKLAKGDIRVPTGFRDPLPEADVAIHCGDLTMTGRIEEFEATLSMLRAIRAPLKLFIAGNHDLSLDTPFWDRYAGEPDTPRRVAYMVDQARQDGVQYLTEGTHSFTLRNGGLLRVYASPYTPAYGNWAFMYENGHDFAIPPGIDVAVTHGPPRGILDTVLYPRGSHEGSPDLFRAVHRAKPRIHCFGHIHEAWGGYLATWKPVAAGSEPSHETAIDAASSRLETLEGLMPSSDGGTMAMTEDQVKRLAALSRQRGVHFDLTAEETRLEQQTFFVNAAIMDVRYRLTQLPWIVDIDLPKS